MIAINLFNGDETYFKSVFYGQQFTINIKNACLVQRRWCEKSKYIGDVNKILYNYCNSQKKSL